MIPFEEFVKKEKTEKLGAAMIIGNGRSLEIRDVYRFEEDSSDNVTFGANRFYLHESGYHPTYYSVVNPLVAKQWHDEISKKVKSKYILLSKAALKEVPADSPLLKRDNIVEVDTYTNHPSFSIEEPIWEGHTVTYFAMQVARALNYKYTYLTGVDHYYGMYDQRPDMLIEMDQVDEYHFDPNYFPKGSDWNAPNIPMSTLAYSLGNDGRVWNVSRVSKLDVFPYQSPNEYFSNFVCTVIVSAYYSEEFLPGCLEDIEKQTYHDIEVIIVCQMDSPEDKIAIDWQNKLDAGDSYIDCKVILTQDIPTIYDAWNKAIREARGRYITNWNTDDRRDPRMIEICVNALKGNPGIDVVYTDAWTTPFDESWDEFRSAITQGADFEPGRNLDIRGVFGWHHHDKRVLADGCYLGPAPVWRAKLHQRYGPFMAQMESAGDYEFWLRVAKDDNFMRITMPLVLYRVREDGVELSDKDRAAEESLQAIVAHQTYTGLELTPIQDGRLKVKIGGNYFLAHPFKMLEGIQNYLDKIYQMPEEAENA